MTAPRVIVITGASSGIGSELAQQYAAPGRHLALIARNRDRLEETAAVVRAAGAEATVASLDITDAQALAAWLTAFDADHPVDLLIANAGVSSGRPPGGLLESHEDVRRTFRINLDGTVNTVLPLLPAMRARGRGQIALVSSIAALRGLASSPAYCGAKAAVKVWGEALHDALAPAGITVTVLCPGYVVSPMSKQLVGPQPFRLSTKDGVRRIIRAITARKRTVTFPFFLVLGIRLLALAPDPLARRILALTAFEVKPRRP